MAVYHILKDGSRPRDITGHIVRLEDNAPLYQFLNTLNRRVQKTDETNNTYEHGKQETKV